MAGLLITVEGIEGAGKSTVLQKVENWWRRRGVQPIPAREPGGTEAGEAIRELLLRTRMPMRPETELFLVQAARSQLMAEVVEPGLRAGQVVLLDRYIDSTTAYQGYGRGLSAERIEQINHFATQGREPDLTILLDVDVRTGLERVGGRKKEKFAHDRFETETIEFIERVRQGFLELARQNAQRFFTVSSKETLEEVWKKIESELARRFLGGEREKDG